MARTNNLTNFLTDIADAIRTKKGTTDAIPASNFDTEIASIEGGGKYAPRYISFYSYKGTDLNEEISNLDTSNMTTMKYMFYDNNNLTSLDLSNFNTSKVTDMNAMFRGLKKVSNLDLSSFDTSKVTDMAYMLYDTNIGTINLSSFDTSNVENMNYMLASNYTPDLDISNFNTSKVVQMRNMFANSKIKTVPNLDTSKAVYMDSLFQSCTGLQSLPSFNCDSATYISDSLRGCKNLQDFGGFINLGMAYLTTESANGYYYKLDVSTCKLLTEQSLINILNGLYDIATKGCNTQQVVLGSTNLAKLTSEEGQAALTNATAKGWTVS